MAKAKAQKDLHDLTYEKALRELQEVVQKLEGGQLALEEAMALFERGQALVGHCSQLLDQAELRLKTLAPGSDVAPQEADLENGPEDGQA